VSTEPTTRVLATWRNAAGREFARVEAYVGAQLEVDVTPPRLRAGGDIDRLSERLAAAARAILCLDHECIEGLIIRGDRVLVLCAVTTDISGKVVMGALTNLGAAVARAFEDA